MPKIMERKLTETEVKFGFIYIDNDEFKSTLPEETKLKVITPANSYHLQFRGRGKRLGWSRVMFRDNNFRQGDVIVLSKTNDIIMISKKESKL